jgi:hypothetical protein
MVEVTAQARYSSTVMRVFVNSVMAGSYFGPTPGEMPGGGDQFAPRAASGAGPHSRREIAGAPRPSHPH